MSGTGHAAAISAIGIGKSFGSFAALKNLSLDIQSGEFLTLLGPSGSGKTTFLMILAGFEAPTSGRLRADGVDITAKPAEARSFGMVFQGYALFPHMSAEANIAFPLRVRNLPAAEIRRRVGADDRAGRSVRAWRRSFRRSCRRASSSGSRSRGRWFSSRLSCS
jgi:putative spermidine/putrescine transport system ATP-binding protein